MKAAVRITEKHGAQILGVFSGSGDKWRFIPHTQHRPSRKSWPSPEAALPKWAGSVEIIDAPTMLDVFIIAKRMERKPA